jgi:polysaccharide biosynthesis/export protein
MQKKLRLLFWGLIIVPLAFSCVRYKQLRYMTDLKSDTLSVAINDSTFKYRIKPGDVLYIKIKSTTDNEKELYNQSLGQSGSSVNQTSNLLNGTLVDEYGDIELPMIGLIRVSGLSVKQAEILIKEKVFEYLNFVTVTVKLMSFRVSVLGEVQAPGVVSIDRVQASIYNVISSAGDLTDLANRKKVRLIRVENGRNKVYTLNMESSQMLGSEFYYVQPGDIIYVEPLRYKIIKANNSTITLGFSLIALTLSIFAIVGKL